MTKAEFRRSFPRVFTFTAAAYNLVRLRSELPPKAAKLPMVRFHDLRQPAASLLIAEGVELVEVSMLLGHSELRVTADLYSHLQQQTAARAAKRMEHVLQVAKDAYATPRSRRQRKQRGTWTTF